MRKNHFDMMSMMSPKGWLGGSDKSSGKLLKQKIEFGLKFDIKIPRCARGLYHLIEIWGGTIWRKLAIFKVKKLLWRCKPNVQPNI